MAIQQLAARFNGASSLVADAPRATVYNVSALLAGSSSVVGQVTRQVLSARALLAGTASFAAAARARLSAKALLAGSSLLLPQDYQRYAGAQIWQGAAALYGYSGMAADVGVPSLATGAWRDILNRVRMLIPHRWFLWAPVLRDAIVGGLATQAAWCYDWFVLARQQSRIATSSGIFLDIICYDYLRRHLMRGSSDDDTFRRKIMATILQERVTRAGVQQVVTDLVDVAPIMFEPWNTGDTGAYGVATFAYGAAGAWGSLLLPAQAFMKVSRSGLGPTGIPGVEGYGGYSGGYDAGSIEYIGSVLAQIGVTDDDIYEIIKYAKPTGVIAWTQIGHDMDRALVFVGERPQTVDTLRTSKLAMVGQGYAARSMLGINMVVEGLACTPTSPVADLNITVGIGSIYALSATDATAYGDLGADAAVIVKQGLLPTPVRFAVTPPAGGGNSQVFLVQATFTEADAGSKVVQYYNGGAIAPLNGPGGSGAAQNTTRTVLCSVALKAGTPAATGSQTTPAADSGYVGLWAVTVANGQTQITTLNIALLPTAPYFPNLPGIPPAIQQSIWTYANDVGTQNALSATVYPPVTALVAGLLVQVEAAFSNNGPCTFRLNGLTVKPIIRANGAALSAGDITAGQQVWLAYDGVNWQLVNYIGPLLTTQTNMFTSYTLAYGTDHGAPNAIVVELSSPVTLAAGLVIMVKVANANTGATTINANGLGAVSVKENGADLSPSAVVAGEIVLLEYSSGVFQKMPPRWSYFQAVAPAAAKTVLAIGDQLVVTFAPATAVPLGVVALPGLYEIHLVIAAHNSTNLTLWLQANDANGGGSFPSWVVNFGPGSFAVCDFNNDNAAFRMPFGFPSASGLMAVIKVSTRSNAKYVAWMGGFQGGASNGFCKWNNASTAWISLGTLVASLNSESQNSLATMSGTAVVKRLA